MESLVVRRKTARSINIPAATSGKRGKHQTTLDHTLTFLDFPNVKRRKRRRRKTRQRALRATTGEPWTPTQTTPTTRESLQRAPVTRLDMMNNVKQLMWTLSLARELTVAGRIIQSMVKRKTRGLVLDHPTTLNT